MPLAKLPQPQVSSKCEVCLPTSPSMRPYYAVLLTLVFVLFACTNAVSAGASTTIETQDAINTIGDVRRSLRSHQAADAVDITTGETEDEERLMTPSAISRLKLKDIDPFLEKTMRQSMKEWSAAQKAKNTDVMKEKVDAMIQTLLMGGVSPPKLFKSMKIGKLVDKMDEAAKETSGYKFFKLYERVYINAPHA